MELIGIIGLCLVVIGFIGIAGGWLYMLFDMLRERDWWHFIPSFSVTCFVVGLITIIIAVKSAS